MVWGQTHVKLKPKTIVMHFSYMLHDKKLTENREDKPSKNSMTANEVDEMRFIVVCTGMGIRSTSQKQAKKGD